MSHIKDISGRRFKSVIALSMVGSDKKGHALWRCVCDCGRTFVTLSNRLLTGNTGTCGCRNGHGMTYTQIYNVWHGIKTRCYTPSKKGNYKFYGAKGIKVCDEWRNNFMAFFNWAVKNGYSPNLTIDRKDSKKEYSPDNCQWITLSQNVKNRWKK